jgi:hypothetical protein
MGPKEGREQSSLPPPSLVSNYSWSFRPRNSGGLKGRDIQAESAWSLFRACCAILSRALSDKPEGTPVSGLIIAYLSKRGIFPQGEHTGASILDGTSCALLGGASFRARPPLRAIGVGRNTYPHSGKRYMANHRYSDNPRAGQYEEVYLNMGAMAHQVTLL